MSAPKHILVFRFSSLGDIAMTVPVIRLLLQQYPQLQVTFVSVAFVKPLLEGIERLHFVAADLKGKHKGIRGLYRLYKELNATAAFGAIADLHNVLRTQVLRFFFAKKNTVAINKGRKEKRELTRQHNKHLSPLPSTFQRYADVFAKLALPVELNIADGIIKIEKSIHNILHSGNKTIGIAPFARYTEKMYPYEKMQQVIRLLTASENTSIILFGGKEDAAALQKTAEENENVISLAGKLSLNDELDIISQLNVMVSMDSANMHLASLYGVPVVSVWGGTHPFLGFLGWGQSMDNCVQIDLDCRPSSVFGNKPCPNHLACMNGILPLVIVEKIFAVLAADNK